MGLSEVEKEARDLMERVLLVKDPEQVKEILCNHGISFSNGKYRSAFFQQIERVKKGYIGEKNHARNHHDSKRVEVIAQKMQKLRVIQKTAKKIYLSKSVSEKPEIIEFTGMGLRRNMPRLSLLREDLKQLDIYSSLDLSPRLEKVFKIKDASTRKESLYQLQEHYRQVQSTIAEYIKTEKGALIRELDDEKEITELLESLRRTKKVSETVIEYLEHSITFEETLLHEKDRKKAIGSLESPETYMDHEETQMYRVLMSGGALDLSQERALRVWKLYLKYGSLENVEQSIVQFRSSLFDQLREQPLEIRQQSYYSILDTLQNRIYRENQLLRICTQDTEVVKDSDQIKKSLETLRRFKKTLLDELNFCNFSLDSDFLSPKEKADRKAIWDTARYFLDNPLCYYHFHALVDTFPEVLLSKDEQDRTLFEEIVTKFISNYQTMLENHRSDYIHPDYYQAIFLSLSHRLVQQQKISPFSEDSREYQFLNDFLYFLDHSKYNFERKGMASRSTRAMLDSEVFSRGKVDLSDSRNPSLSISADLLESFYYMKEMAISKNFVRSELRYDYLKDLPWKVEEIRMSMKEKYQEDVNLDTILCDLQVPKSDYVNSLSNGKVFALGDPSHLYSVHSLSNGEYYLRMHVLDMTSCMEENSPIAQYLYDASFRPHDDLLDKYFCSEYFLGEEDPLPAITYQVKIGPSGRCGNFHIYQSKIQVDEVVQSLENYRDDEEKKSLVGVYRILSQDLEQPKLDCVRQVFDRTMNYSALVYATNKELPVIATGISSIPEEEQLTLQISLCEEFFKMTKSTFQKSYRIINTNWDPEHLVNGNYTEGMYTASIFTTKNYLDYFNQRLLLVSDRKMTKDTLDDYREESDTLVRTFNQHQGYVGRKEFDRKEIFQKRKKTAGSNCQPIVKNSQNSCNFQ